MENEYGVYGARDDITCSVDAMDQKYPSNYNGWITKVSKLNLTLVIVLYIRQNQNLFYQI